MEKDIFDKSTLLIKKILKWCLYILAGLIIISLLVWGATSFYIYQTKTRHENRITVTTNISDECPNDFPLKVVILNNSNKTIESIKIYTKAHREGYSKNLLSYNNSIESDKIISPKEMYSSCWRIDLDYPYKDKYRPSELIWEPQNYYVEFK